MASKQKPRWMFLCVRLFAVACGMALLVGTAVILPFTEGGRMLDLEYIHAARVCGADVGEGEALLSEKQADLYLRNIAFGERSCASYLSQYGPHEKIVRNYNTFVKKLRIQSKK